MGNSNLIFLLKGLVNYFKSRVEAGHVEAEVGLPTEMVEGEILGGEAPGSRTVGGLGGGEDEFTLLLLA